MRDRLARIDFYRMGDFRCTHCRGSVCADPSLSGVNHRNHCPYCLWSRHLDLFAPGDRLSACKAPMRPVALTVKRVRKKYGSDRPGELMLVHQCVECGALSINRTAADDDAQALLEVFEGSFRHAAALKARFEHSGIEVLGEADAGLVRARVPLPAV